MTSPNRNNLRFVILQALLLVTIVAAFLGSAWGAVGDQSPDGIWVEVDPSVLAGVTAPLPTAFRVYRADEPKLRSLLATAPMEDLHVSVPPSPLIITLPLDATFAPVSVVQSPVLAPALAAQYPSIKTFAARGANDASLIGRLTQTSRDFQALVRPSSDAIRILPVKTSSETF